MPPPPFFTLVNQNYIGLRTYETLNLSVCQVLSIRNTPRALHYYHSRLVTAAAKGTWKRRHKFASILDGTLNKYSRGVFEVGLA